MQNGYLDNPVDVLGYEYIERDGAIDRILRLSDVHETALLEAGGAGDSHWWRGRPP